MVPDGCPIHTITLVGSASPVWVSLMCGEGCHVGAPLLTPGQSHCTAFAPIALWCALGPEIAGNTYYS